MKLKKGTIPSMNTKSSRRRSILLALLALFLSAVLACNLPMQQAATNIPAETLQITLAALQARQTQAVAVSLSPTTLPVDGPLYFGEATVPPLAPAPTQTAQADTSELPIPDGHLRYILQAGDTLPALSLRFDVEAAEILAESPLPVTGLLTPGQPVLIPDRFGETRYPLPALPDCEITYSPAAVEFNVSQYVQQAGGFLATYREQVHGQSLSGAEIIQRVAELNSTNPRFLLAFLELRSGWVFGQPSDPQDLSYPIGFNISGQRSLYQELNTTANQLNAGYYGWRAGTLSFIKFPDGSLARLSPGLNAGTVAVQRLLAFFYQPLNWEAALYGPEGFTNRYTAMFGDPWQQAAAHTPLLPAGLEQPALELPFVSGLRWALTGGPHYSWSSGSPRGALDFAPVTGQIGCETSTAWATAAASGVVVRTGEGLLALDLDGDGFEQTGWVLVYVHLAEAGRAAQGARVTVDTPLGHPSCEGGNSTGAHLHLARKYNGEWIAISGPLPFTLSGWQAVAGESNYSGYLTQDGRVVASNVNGLKSSMITR